MGFKILLALIILVNLVSSFNVDIDSAKVIQNKLETNSFFGYSIAFLKSKSLLLVGAPLSKQSSRKSGGAVFECDYSAANKDCEVSSRVDQKPVGREKKDQQWMGATVYSDNYRFLACAPRSLTIENVEGLDLGRLLGKCDHIDVDLTKDKDFVWKPCLLKYRTVEGFDSCQAGFSAKIFGGGTKYNMLTGIPNAALGTGILGLDDDVGRSPSFTNDPKMQIFDYMGYATSTGKMKVNADNSTSVVAIGGAPRANNLRGQVVMYDVTEKNFPAYTSAINDPSEPTQTGTYFGSVLAAADINGDSIDDLIIGAPYYSGKHPNEGAVYVYVNKMKDGMTNVQNLYGEKETGALFGYAIGSVGDLNQDGYADIAIGAPYGGRQQKGVVYLFYGSQNDKPLQYKQRIAAEDVDSALNGFGNAFAEHYQYDGETNNDVDLNQYPDLAVGAHRSDRAVIFKSRPVASIIATRYDTGNTKQIDLYKTDDMCDDAPDGEEYKCIPLINICFLLSGLNIGTSGGDVEFTFDIDSDQKVGKRGFLIVNGKPETEVKQLMNVSTTSIKCEKLKVYLYNSTDDIFRPLVLKLSWDYKPPTDPKLCPNELCPVANEMYSRSNQLRVPYIKGCSGDGNDVCNTDLKLDMTYDLPDGSTTISVGVTTVVYLRVSIKNLRENAFINKLQVEYPEQVTPNNVIITDYAGTPIWDPNTTRDKALKTLSVTLSSFIATNGREDLTLVFGLNNIAKATKTITFTAKVVTESKEENESDNVQSITIDVVLKANLTVSGNVMPEQVKWRQASTSTDIIGTEIKHTFFFQNKGPSSAETSDILIEFPETYDGNYMLNIYKVTLEGTSTQGSIGKCEHGQLNPLSLKEKVSTSRNSTSRKKREADEIADLNCGGSVKCRDITCKLNFLQRNEGATVSIYSTLVEATFEKYIKDSRELRVFAKFTSKDVARPPNAPPDSLYVTLTVLSPLLTKEEKGDPIAWWIILLCILAAILIIGVIVLIMYKKGFFKRKRRDGDDSAANGEADELKHGAESEEE